jgi:hypothetical protein
VVLRNANENDKGLEGQAGLEILEEPGWPDCLDRVKVWEHKIVTSNFFGSLIIHISIRNDQ